MQIYCIEFLSPASGTCTTPVTTMHPNRKRRNENLESVEYAIIEEMKANRTSTDLEDEYEMFGKMLTHRLRKMANRNSSLTMAKINVLLHEIEHDDYI